MNYAHTADSFYVPNVRQRPKKRSWLWRLFFGSPKPMPMQERRRPAANDDVQDVPPWKRQGGTAGLPALPEESVPPRPKFGDYIEKPPPAPPMPAVELDHVAEAKLHLRKMTWKQFTDMAAAFGCDPKRMHEAAMESA